MSEGTVTIRLMRAEDFDAVVAIDEKILNARRQEYYDLKFDRLVRSRDCLPTSLVAVDEAGKVVGFIMGELFVGEYGISQEKATLDTIGVDPDCQQRGIGERLMDEFLDHLKKLGVEKVNTLVGWDNSKMIRFFSANRFGPSRTINLERSL